MTPRKFDATVADWLREGPETGPRYGLDRALAATHRIEQRPGWLFPRRYVPWPAEEWGLQMPAGVPAAAVLALTCLLLLAVAIVAFGTRPPDALRLLPASHRLIAFQEGQAIFVGRLDGSDRRKLSGDLPFAYGPVFSPDGTRVAFLAPAQALETGGRLYVARVDGTGVLIDAGRGLDVVSGQVPSITWSPDGTQLAFAARSDGVSRIFVTAGIGADVTPITDGAANADLPTWSPDGSVIAFRVTDLDGVRRHIETVRPDGSALTPINDMITADSSFSKPHFHPSNGQLAYAVNYGFGGQTRALIDWQFTHTAEVWANGIGGWRDAGVPFSPDGKHLAFITAADGVIVAEDDENIGVGGDVYDGRLRRLGNVAGCWIDWVPDGSALYGGSPDGCTGVVVIPLDAPTSSRRLPTATSGFASWQLPLP
jgi:Tol biopolymer transport system component